MEVEGRSGRGCRILVIQVKMEVGGVYTYITEKIIPCSRSSEDLMRLLSSKVKKNIV